jgi:hypothetical protein
MKKKRKSLVEAELAMDRFLKRVGYTGKLKDHHVNEIPVYRTHRDSISTSDTIPTNTPKKYEHRYSGMEISGIVTTHKSNLMPIRKDNKQAAVDAAQMRRN